MESNICFKAATIAVMLFFDKQQGAYKIWLLYMDIYWCPIIKICQNDCVKHFWNCLIIQGFLLKLHSL